MLPDRSTPTETEGEQGAWARPLSARLGDTIVAVTLLAAGVFFVWQASLLPFGHVGLPGPGFFPFALGIALGLLVLALLFAARHDVNAGEAVFLGHRDVLVTLIALGAVASTFERIGALVSLGGFTVIMLLLVARTALWRALLGAALLMLAVWLFFELALGLRLPDGDLWEQIADYLSAPPTN